MGVFDNYFPLGLGTSRLPISGPNDTGGIDRSIDLILNALDAGINYIDTSYTYAAGMAFTALKPAFAATRKPYGVTLKVMHDMDKTSDETRRMAEFQLKALGIDKAAFFVCWNILSYDSFLAIINKGGIYDGALKLKSEGLVGHICCSLHATQADNIKIIESGMFEGATISHSLLNAAQSAPVLDAAFRNNVEVAVMNPLGGGIIPENAGFFDFACSHSEGTITAALRFAMAHPSVKIILSGISNKNELDENIRAVMHPGPELPASRLARVEQSIREIKGFCVNCHYCDGCPAKIPVAELMNKRNTLLFSAGGAYNRHDPEIVRNIRLFQSHTSVGAADWFPESPENPCTRCGKCEKKCTQKLEIMDAIKDTFRRAEVSGFSLQSHKARLEELLADRNYRRVGLYPNGGFANKIMGLYKQFFGEPAFEWIQFNSDPKMWGQSSGGLFIYAPDKIGELKPDLIIVCTYKYDKEIYEDLRSYEDNGVKIVKLHKMTDVPWVF